MSSVNKKNSSSDNNGKPQEVVSVVYEEIGLFPRSFSRVLDRFLKQVFSDVENLVIQEYRFYRYLFLTTLKCLFILFFVPFFVNFLAKTYVVRPLTEYFWNTKQPEIFLNSYQQKHAFAELKDFEEKLYFESLIYPKTASFIPEGEKAAALSAAGRPNSPLTAPEVSLSPNTFNENQPKADATKTSIGVSSKKTVETNNTNVEKGSAFDLMSSNRSEETGITVSVKGTVNMLNSDTVLLTSTRNSLPEGNETSNIQLRETLVNESKEINKSLSNNELTNSLKPMNGISSSSQMNDIVRPALNSDEKTESLINAYTLKSSLFVYQTIEADKNIQQRYQEKTIELAQRYNDQSIEAITNFFADLISLFTLFYLLYALEIQINITKSFLLEVFFGLDDSKKSLLILLVTDLLVGYHSSNLWELFFEFLFHHYGLPESQTGIFLLVATLPVLLDVLFKYLIFRHLNRSSPATVATYHAMIE